MRSAVDELETQSALFNKGAIVTVENVARVMESIEERTDSDVSEVKASKDEYGVVEEATKPIGALFSVLTAERMMGVFDSAPKRAPHQPRPWQEGRRSNLKHGGNR